MDFHFIFKISQQKYSISSCIANTKLLVIAEELVFYNCQFSVRKNMEFCHKKKHLDVGQYRSHSHINGPGSINKSFVFNCFETKLN